VLEDEVVVVGLKVMVVEVVGPTIDLEGVMVVLAVTLLPLLPPPEVPPPLLPPPLPRAQELVSVTHAYPLGQPEQMSA